MTPRSLGMVVALQAEAAALTSRPVPQDRRVILSEGCSLWLSGMGPASAGRAAQALATSGVEALAAFGVAGALDPDLRSGTLLCPDRVVDEEGHVYQADAVWHHRLQHCLKQAGLPILSEGALLSLSRPLCTAAAKTAACVRYDVVAVDMESAAVAAVAARFGLPFVMLRSIIDERDDALPEALQGIIDPWGRPRALPLIAALSCRPWLLTRLPTLSSRMRKAVGALRAAALAAPDLVA